MASMPVLLLFFMLFAKECTAESTIELGSQLSPEGSNRSWASSSGRFAFGFYPLGNGFAVGIWLVTPHETQNTIVWTANRDSPSLSPNSTLALTMHGRLLLRNGEVKQDLIMKLGNSDSDSEPIGSATMHDSGNFVLYSNRHSVIWQSFDDPTDTILGGQNLTTNKELVSSMSKSDHSSGYFFLRMQDDGNLVAYPVNSTEEADDAYWASMTFAQAYIASLNDSGFLCLSGYNHECYNDTISPLRNKSQNTSSIYRATLDVDGNLRLYEHLFEVNGSSEVQILWQALSDYCQIKGFCGFNSYCSNMSGRAVCQCYPGFIPSKSSGNVSRDCILQTHIKADCESSEDPTMLYNVTWLENMTWGSTPYSVIQAKKESCEKSFREDCDCSGVLYSDGNCNKYRLPLVYGRMVQNSSTVALLKTPSGSNTGISSRKPKVIVDTKRNLIMTLGLTLGGVSLLALVFPLSFFLTYRRQVSKYAALSTSEKMGLTEECSLRSFSFDELVQSTESFTEEIGRGSFGAVYRGTIGDTNRKIAVKRLERIADEGEREFRAEITAIARTHHRNLVKLIGFCIDGSRKLLVYEYVSNGSLANLLFNGEKRLSWRDKIKIALDVARGVLYLHEECGVRIIHCNIKPRNILMDEAWTAKISDFGLAKLSKPEYSRMKEKEDGISTYLAPEWQKGASLSVKSDVYSFGVVLLEIVCRRGSIDMNVSSPEEIHLSSWVYQCFAAGELNRLVKDDEEEGIDGKLLERMVKVGLWCVQDNPPRRPSMMNVILMLEGLKDIPIPPSPVQSVK